MTGIGLRRDAAGRAFLVLCALVFAAKVALASTLPLFGDEAFYWQESRHPAWAYSDLPGATAWLVWLGTAVGGDTLLGVRWPFLLMGAAIPFLVARIAAQLGGDAAGARAGALALLLPLSGTLGVLALPDVPMTFAAMLCLDAGARLLRGVTPGACAELAAGLALGALAHYRFALVVVAGATALLLSREGRAALRDPRVWTAVAIGAVAWIPLLAWNLQHGDVGLRFQLVDRHPWRLHAGGALFPFVQLVFVTPLLCVALVVALRDAWRGRGEALHAYLLGAGAVPVLGYGVLGFFADTERVSFHWALPGWLALLALAPAVLARWPRGWRRATWAVAGLGLAVALGYLLAAASPALRARLAGTTVYPDNFAGWRDVAAEVDAALERLPPETRLVVDNFMLAAQLGFARGDGGVEVLDHPLNHKHGRAPQLALWDHVVTAIDRREGPVLLAVEDTAQSPRLRLDWYGHLCAVAGIDVPPQVLNVDGGRKRFLLFPLPARAQATPAACVLPALAWIDVPAPGARVGRRFGVAGWAFKDGAGIARVEILLDGEPVAEAAYGAAAPHVAEFWRTSSDPAHPDVGFAGEVDVGERPDGAYRLGVRLHGRDGSSEDWPEQVVVVEGGEAGPAGTHRRD
ncbi:ArnT family glycosyltransferase [Coralloluteibacterium thermophilus]|uniref:ArnT family glycosyltransferase n=1 Tax=Coralloluteibacterium thermophilum TaxID=2707049 RepID=A0ABV9NH61_9GAMM